MAQRTLLRPFQTTNSSNHKNRKRQAPVKSGAFLTEGRTMRTNANYKLPFALKGVAAVCVFGLACVWHGNVSAADDVNRTGQGNERGAARQLIREIPLRTTSRLIRATSLQNKEWIRQAKFTISIHVTYPVKSTRNRKGRTKPLSRLNRAPRTFGPRFSPVLQTSALAVWSP
jgi:hypothetical protein